MAPSGGRGMKRARSRIQEVARIEGVFSCHLPLVANRVIKTFSALLGDALSSCTSRDVIDSFRTLKFLRIRFILLDLAFFRFSRLSLKT